MPVLIEFFEDASDVCKTPPHKLLLNSRLEAWSTRVERPPVASMMLEGAEDVDTALGELLVTAAELFGNTIVCSRRVLNPSVISAAMSDVEKNDLICASIVMHPNTWAEVGGWGKEFVSAESSPASGVFGRSGYIYSSDVYEVAGVPEDMILFIGLGGFLGSISADEVKVYDLGAVSTIKIV